MGYEIEVRNDAGYPIDAAALVRAVTVTLEQHQSDVDSTLTVVLVADEVMASYNRQFRGVDAPTDVLSFPADAPPVDIPGEAPYLGDLLIAYPYASAQARQEGHPVSDSLSLLVVHGTLHLLGYDHDTIDARAEMWAAQDEALTALGISTAIVPSLEQLPDHTDDKE